MYLHIVFILYLRVMIEIFTGKHYDADIDIYIIIIVTNLLDFFIQQPSASRVYVERFWPVTNRVNE